ncbi:hypothetical protein [Paraflavitalea speifideaquila]|uniref:hypothetical protein n=1 Tax=Paraflavitalea speifideaquila TaxID=3076558 RepID=UPI0028E61F65|nr:hypothetical protein [Paraflavitalea speifideiaquila]
MRYLFVVTSTVLLFAACTDASRQANGITPGDDELIARNIGITRANSYSDLFMDSMAMEGFIAAQKLNDTVTSGMRNFYNARNYQYAWFASDGLTEQALAFRNLYDYTKDSGTTQKALDRKLENLMAEDSLQLSASDGAILKTEFMLTWRYVNYIWDHYNSKNARLAALTQLVPARKYPVKELAQAELDNKEAPNKNYKALKEQLARYMAIEQKSGWGSIPLPQKQLKKGAIDTVVVLIKKEAAGNRTTRRRRQQQPIQ